MQPADLFRMLHDAGVTVRADDGKLLVRPAELLTDELRTAIRDYKPDLLAFVAKAHRTTTELLAAAMKVCDHYGDSDKARADMRVDVLATPVHLRADLLEHFWQTRPTP
ncbi:TubC N-terminal docking domain-related protein [Variovorax soli]|uniref:TubC N-terminal docking domain-related protein n=1 Tax=Variovorax soli TaxID=376815 RepID=UPI0008396CA1|nr:hypothetical protein [Variovorax soli]